LPTIVSGVLEHQGDSCVTSSKHAATESVVKFDSVLDGNKSDNNGTKATTTDKNTYNTQKSSVNDQLQESYHANCGETADAAERTTAQNKKSKKQKGSSIGSVQPEATQVWSAKNKQTEECCKKLSVIPKSKDSSDLAQAPAELKASNAKCTANLSTVSAKPLIANGQIEKGKNCNQAPVSNKTVIIGSDKEATDGEKSAMTDKQAVSGNQKTPTNAGLHANNNKSIDDVGLSKSAQLAKTPTDNKTAADQQAVLGTSAPSESSSNSGKSHAAYNILNGSILKKLNSEQIISTDSGTKNKGNSSTTSSNFEDNSPKTFKQMFSSNSAQSPVPQESSATASASKVASTALPSEVSTSISKQIQESIHSSLRQGKQQITIRLNPPELGKVSIQFREQDGQIIGLLEVSRAQTRVEIQQALPQIIQNLAESGVQVKRLEVLLTNQQEQQGFKNQPSATGADGWSGQGQAGANSDPQGNNPSWVETNEWLTNSQSYTSFIEPGVQITGDSINMLA